MTRRELIAYFGFKVESKPLEELEKRLESVKSRVEFLAGVELVKGLYELTQRFTKFAEELNAVAVSAGITVEQLQRLTFAAGQSAVTQDEMTTSMARLGRQLYEARNGGEQAQKAFSDIGFTPEQVQGFKNSSQALLALSDRFKGIEDPIKKQALAMQLLGRGSINMVAFLSRGSGAIHEMGKEAEELGIILSTKQIDALRAVEESLNKTSAIIKAVSATLASYLAPSVKTAIEDMIQFYKANRALIELNLRNWVYQVTYAMGFTYQAVKFLIVEFLNLAKALHLEGDILPFIGTLISVVSTVLLLTKSLKVLGYILGPTATAVEFFFAAFGKGKLILAAAIEGIAYLTNSLWLLSIAEFLATIPAWLLVAAIGAIVLIAEELYALFTGKKSWLDSFAEWLVSIDAVRNALQYVADIWAGITKNTGNFFSKIGGSIGSFFGSDSAASTARNIGDTPQLSSPAFGIPGANTQNYGSQSNYSVNAPMTFNIAPGTDARSIGEQVREGVRDHLDTTHRRTQQSLRSGQKY